MKAARLRLSLGPRWLEAGLLLLLAAVGTSPARADVTIYHSPGDDGAPPNATPIMTNVSETFYLYLDLSGNTSSQSGVACEDGDGAEICGWEVGLRAGPAVRFDSFVPTPGVVSFLEDARHLRANGINAVTPSVEPARIGALTITRTKSTGGTVAARASAVAADLTVKTVAATTVVVVAAPEPRVALMQIVALALVIAMRRHFCASLATRLDFVSPRLTR